MYLCFAKNLHRLSGNALGTQKDYVPSSNQGDSYIHFTPSESCDGQADEQVKGDAMVFQPHWISALLQN